MYSDAIASPIVIASLRGCHISLARYNYCTTLNSIKLFIKNSINTHVMATDEGNYDLCFFLFELIDALKVLRIMLALGILIGETANRLNGRSSLLSHAVGLGAGVCHSLVTFLKGDKRRKLAK